MHTTDGGMDGADYIIEVLNREKIDTIFTVPGAQIETLFNRLSQTSHIRPVVCSHEAGAAFMADGYARMKNLPGVVLVNGGPGLSNLITGISVARSEYVPLLVISGNVPTYLAEQQAFQDAGQWGSKDLFITENITKYASFTGHIEQLPVEIEKAFAALEEKPEGPAHLIIPNDLFAEHVPEELLPQKNPHGQQAVSDEDIKTIENLLLSRPNVALCAGESLNRLDARPSLIKVCEHYGIPLLTTYGSKGIIPENHPLNFGNIGYAGRKSSNRLLLSETLDGVIYLGAQLNERNTLNWNDGLFSPERTIIHIDFDAVNRIFDRNSRINRIIGNPGACVKKLAQRLRKSSEEIRQQRNLWVANLKASRQEYSTPAKDVERNGLEPALVMEKLNTLLPDNTTLFVDSGQHRVFPGFYYRVSNERSFFTSSIIASTGWALCAAIGAKKADPGQPVFVVAGDCCMRMHGLDIQTAVREKLAVVFLVFNNRTMGSVLARQMKQQLSLDTLVNHYDNDWKMFAESFGACGATVNTEKELEEEIEKSLASTGKPTVIDINIAFPSYFPEEIHTKSAYA